MEGAGLNNTFSILLMLVVTSILITVNSLEVINLVNQWNLALQLNPIYFNTCIKFPYILKSFFVAFSIFATVCIFFLTLSLLLSPVFFISKLFKSFLEFVYFIYGPGICMSSILAFYNWNEFVYVCDLRYTGIVLTLSVSNIFSIILCFIIGIFIWIGKDLFETLVLFSNSITRHPEGSDILRKIFWGIIFKLKMKETYSNYQRENELLRNEQINNNIINDNEMNNVNRNIHIVEEEKKDADGNVLKPDSQNTYPSNRLNNEEYVNLIEEETKRRSNRGDSVLSFEKKDGKEITKNNLNTQN